MAGLTQELDSFQSPHLAARAFDLALMLVEEMPRARLVNAESILEWRISPGRLDDELAAFVAEAYSTDALASLEAR